MSSRPSARRVVVLTILAVSKIVTVSKLAAYGNANATLPEGADTRDHEQLTAGENARPARAFLRSDAPQVDLSGDSASGFPPRAETPEHFARPAFDDSGW